MVLGAHPAASLPIEFSASLQIAARGLSQNKRFALKPESVDDVWGLRAQLANSHRRYIKIVMCGSKPVE